jgi:hypothetical protein
MPEIDSSKFPRLYRAISRRAWINQISAAFRLKEGEDALSVILWSDCTKDACDAQLNTCFGEFVLETQSVNNLGLRVEPDLPEASDYRENHANIFGLPPYGSNEKEIEDIISALEEKIIGTQHRPK